MVQNYRFTGDMKCIIYGASNTGKHFYDNFAKQHLNVQMFLDRNPSASKILACPVTTLEMCPIEQAERGDYLVIIAVEWKFEHEIIASLLSSSGFSKILYLPQAAKTRECLQLVYAYNALFAYHAPQNWVLPVYQNAFATPEQTDGKIKQFDDGHVLVYIPTEVLFTSLKDDFDELNECYSTEEFDCSIYCNYAANCLFEYFETGVDSTGFLSSGFEKRFIEAAKQPQPCMTPNSLAYAKHLVYKYFTIKLNEDYHFPVNSPAFARFNPKGYFNITRNQDMVTFLLCKNYNKIPVVISNSDYELWLNQAMLAPVLSEMGEAYVSYTAIPHPYFYNYSTFREDCGLTRLRIVSQYLAKHQIAIKGASVLDVAANALYFSQHFSRMGAQVTAIEMGDRLCRVGNALSKLMYLQNIEVHSCKIQDYEGDRRFDMTFLFSLTHWFLDCDEGKQILRAVDRLTGHYLIWESGGSIERERQSVFENTGFQHYHKIADTFGSNNFRELGIFTR